ncbi:Uncharacterised protein [Serratia rubidaea]|uniref:Uncharacterized protein n=1 Tax=Serratia rubidaea TaxID=61652 RepID=A0A3S4GFT9_SERRU|nr:Uncharacterised protein [Serratia rubidaea]
MAIIKIIDKGDNVLTLPEDALNIKRLAEHLGVPVATFHAWCHRLGLTGAILKAKQRNAD